jgi:diadenylate cyclase
MGQHGVVANLKSEAIQRRKATAMIEDMDLLEDILIQERSINLQTLSEVITLAVEIAREGREGRKVGTLFVISDEQNVLATSKPLILDPLWHHPSSEKNIRNPDMRETIKELAQLDGAFVVADDGTVLSACRYINASAEGISLPLGLGSRHMAAASITKSTNCIAVAVSESSMVRVFDNGELISEIIPEIWLLKTYSSQIKGIYSTRSGGQLTVASKTTENIKNHSSHSD